MTQRGTTSRVHPHCATGPTLWPALGLLNPMSITLQKNSLIVTLNPVFHCGSAHKILNSELSSTYLRHSPHMMALLQLDAVTRGNPSETYHARGTATGPRLSKPLAFVDAPGPTLTPAPTSTTLTTPTTPTSNYSSYPRTPPTLTPSYFSYSYCHYCYLSDATSTSTTTTTTAATKATTTATTTATTKTTDGRRSGIMYLDSFIMYVSAWTNIVVFGWVSVMS